MKALDPGLSPERIKVILQRTAVDLEVAGFDHRTGHGRIDAHAALLRVLQDSGDIDGDGAIDINDLLILIVSWGPCPSPPEPCPADLDDDWIVGISDLVTLLGNWG